MRPWLEEQLDRFRQALEERFGSDLVTLAVFGSQAQEREHLESDWTFFWSSGGFRADGWSDTA